MHSTLQRNTLRSPPGKDALFSASYCTWRECERPISRRGGKGRPYCDMHEKRAQRGTDMDAPVQERLTPKQRHLEAAIRLVEAETDEEYRAAERAVLDTARALAPQAMGARVREGMAAARARGVRFGRPPKVQPQQAQALVQRLGTVRLAALALGVDPGSVRRALSRAAQGGVSHRAHRAEPRGETPPSGPSAR